MLGILRAVASIRLLFTHGPHRTRSLVPAAISESFKREAELRIMLTGLPDDCLLPYFNLA